jgi:hypothetical protein
MNRANLPIGDHAYTSVAVYYEDADSLEYVRHDVPSVYRRIDDLLTLVLSMKTREVMGFKLKGFRHFYLKNIQNKVSTKDDQFPELIVILEQAIRKLGNEVFEERERLSAYATAREIAQEDEVHISDIRFVA